eukprot:1960123-Amphidinium_carterae.1
MVQSGEPEGLLTWSARSAFKGSNKAFLKKLDAEEIGSISTETDLGDIVFVMMQSVLTLGDSEIVELMKKRCLTPHLDEREQILSSEEAEEAMTTDGKEELKRMKLQVEIAEESEKEVLKTIRKRIEMQKSGGPASKKLKSTDVVWPSQHDLTLGKAEKCLPPNAKLWADNRCNRFQVFLLGGSCSRSWMGMDEAHRDHWATLQSARSVQVDNHIA